MSFCKEKNLLNFNCIIKTFLQLQRLKVFIYAIRNQDINIKMFYGISI